MKTLLYLLKTWIVYSLISGLILSVISGCAYRWGASGRSLPGGYSQVYIPLFKNYSMEPGVEVSFTNQLKLQFERSKVARVSNEAQAEVILEGEILSIRYVPMASSASRQQPDVVLVSTYDVQVDLAITLKRASDRTVLWQSFFKSARSYGAPQVSQGIINSVNPLYNLSARRQNIDLIASSMMNEAHDRISENY